MTNKTTFPTTTITGTLRYPNVLTPREGFNGGPAQYSIEVSVDAAEEARVRSMGMSSRSTTKVDEHGTRYLRFTLPAKDKNGNDTVLPVVDSQGNDITTAIANGSTGIVKVTFLPGKGVFGGTARLTAVKVTNHIPYESDGLTPEQRRAKALEGLVTQVKPDNKGFGGI